MGQPARLGERRKAGSSGKLILWRPPAATDPPSSAIPDCPPSLEDDSGRQFTHGGGALSVGKARSLSGAWARPNSPSHWATPESCLSAALGRERDPVTQVKRGPPGGARARLQRRPLQTTAPNFFPLEAPSGLSLPFLPSNPLNGPPPSLLSSSLPVSVRPFSSPPSPQVLFFPCSLGVRPVNHPRAGPCPAPPCGPVSERLGLLSPAALPSAESGDLSAEPAGGEPRGPPGLGLPVTDSVSMANNLTRLLSGAGRPRVR